MCQYARYVPIYTDMGDFLQGMSTHIDMKKLAEICAYYYRIDRLFTYLVNIAHFTMEVIASVEKYENARMKFSTVPAFALAESRASDACCLFLVQKHTRAKSACFPPQESSDQVLELIADVATHSLDPRAATRAVPVRNLPAAAHAALL